MFVQTYDHVRTDNVYRILFYLVSGSAKGLGGPCFLGSAGTSTQTSPLLLIVLHGWAGPLGGRTKASLDFPSPVFPLQLSCSETSFPISIHRSGPNEEQPLQQPQMQARVYSLPVAGHTGKGLTLNASVFAFCILLKLVKAMKPPPESKAS